MNVNELAVLVEGTIITTTSSNEKEVTSMYTCDMLSWAMAKLPKDAAFVTIVNNKNIIAVSVLVEATCIILSEGVDCDQAVIDKANEEEIPIICTPLSSYEVCVRYGFKTQ